jgi:hypothetical protein
MEQESGRISMAYQFYRATNAGFVQTSRESAAIHSVL